MNRSIRRPSAIIRAQKQWGECALFARSSLRARGIRGDLRPLDEIASGRRGKAVPTGISQLALDLHRAGMSGEEIRALLSEKLTDIVHEVTSETGPNAA